MTDNTDTNVLKCLSEELLSPDVGSAQRFIIQNMQLHCRKPTAEMDGTV